MTTDAGALRPLRGWLAGFVTLVCGCEVGPHYQPPALPLGAEAPWSGRDAALESTAPLPDDWWHLYENTSLQQLVQEALRSNRDLAAADANFAAARAVISAVDARRYPSTDAIGAGTYGRDPLTDEILELGGHEPQTIWLFEDVFQVAYEVDLFGRVRRSIEAADANAQAAAAIRDSVRVIVAADTAREYAAICALGAELAVAHQSVDIVTREANITAQRYQAGSGSQYDVKRALAVVDQVQATLPLLEGQRRAALLALTALLGRTPARAPTELLGCMTPPHLASLIPLGDGRELIRRRPDVRQAERRLAGASAQIGIATADLYPRISLTGFFGGAATEVPQLNTNVGRIWGVGPSISWAFPNQAGPRARIREAKAFEQAALASFDSVVLTALKETEQALAAYSTDLAHRQSLADAQANLHTAFEVARNGYAAGALSTLDLLTTEQSLVAVDAAVAASDTRLVEDQIALFKALGGGWRENRRLTRVAQ